MVKKAVLFDLDDTLYDYNVPHKKALKGTYKICKKDLKIPERKFLALYDISKNEIKNELAGTASSHNRVIYFQRLIEKTHNTINPNIILTMYKTYWKNFLKNMKIKKEVIPILKELKKRKIKTAIVTDLTTHIQLRKMQRLRISSYIDWLITSEESGSEKPNSKMFLLALNKLNILAQEAIMVGDNKITDIEGANAVGIDSVIITRKKIRANKEDYKKPNFVIKQIPEILGILKRFEK